MKRSWFQQLTLTQQWIAISSLAVLPLLAALVYAAWSLSEQARHQSQLLASVDNLNNMDAFIQRQLAGMERVSRQYMLIGDARFADLYRERLTALADYQINLVVTLPSGREQRKLTELLERSSRLGTRLYADEMDAKELETLWTEINREREELSELIDGFATESAAAGDEYLRQVHRRLAYIGSGSVALTLLLFSLSSFAVTNPVRRLASSIQRMGRQEWHTPVRIQGPKDLIGLGDNLEWMRQELLASDRQKQAFLHHITHELKTPLAAIMEAESLLRDQVPGPLTGKQMSVLAILHQNARSLQTLIQQLLNYNAIKHSHALDYSAVDIRELGARLSRQLAQANPDKQVHYEFSGPRQDIPTDRQCLEMILSNLLSNAHRCVTDAGRIRVNWNSDAAGWQLTVTDDGPGIAPEEQEDIFKPFYQGNCSRQQKGPLKGSGMGLAIVRECVHRLGGSIRLESDSGRGATFIMHFPKGEQLLNEAA